MKINILYFASLGENLGCDNEQLSLPEGISSLSELKHYLAQRDKIWHRELIEGQVKCAVNQEITNDKTSLKDGDEIAFFPPVTGG